MMGLSGPRARGIWRSEIPVVVGLAIAVIAAVLVSDLPTGARRAVSGAALVSAPAILTALSFDHWRRAHGSRRRAWTFLGLSAAVASLGNLGLLLLGHAAGTDWPPAPVGLLMILALALGVVGVLRFPAGQRRRLDLVRMGLEGLVLGGSFLFVVSVTLLSPVLPPDRTELGQAVLLANAVIDVMVATVAALLAWRSAESDRSVLFLAAAAFAAISVSDFGLLLTAPRATVALGNPVDLGWIAGYALLVLAALRAGSSSLDAASPRELSPVVGTILIFGVFLLATGIGVVALARGDLSMPAVVVAVITLCAVAARQLILIVDHQNLRRTLERRVFDRTTALRAITQQTTLLFNSLGEGVYGVDATGLVTFLNPAAAQALGHPAHDLIGRSAHDTFHRPSTAATGHADAATCYVTRAVSRQLVTQAAEDTYLRADGDVIPVEVTATPVSQNGQVQGAVVVFRDVTHRREVDRMKNEFVSMVSHELRTPLTSIRGSLGLLGGGAFGRLDGQAERMVDLALQSTDRLTRLVDDILDIERIESGELSMMPGIHVVSDLIAAAVAQVQVIAADSEIEVRVGAADGWVGADGDRVVQVLLNLLGNAIKFSPPGRAVDVSAVVRGSAVEFSVIDLGRGVPPHKLDAIFARFQQVDTSDARAKGGVGLGLSICRSLVERMGGRIWAENNPGPGVTFSFTLPGGRLAANPVLSVVRTAPDSETGAGSAEVGPAPASSAEPLGVHATKVPRLQPERPDAQGGDATPTARLPGGGRRSRARG